MTRLSIISDPVCPWCYIGAANLFAAFPGSAPPFEISWAPFQLNPDMPPEGMDRATYLAAKFGGADAAERVYDRVGEAARAAGLDIDFAAIPRTPNTLDAHRLLRWSAAQGAQTRVKMALFRRYFTDLEDISAPEVLRATAEEAGMDGAVVARLLAGDADRDEVRAEADAARAMRVTGVPTFIVGGRYAVGGAQPPEVWTKLAAELSEATAPA